MGMAHIQIAPQVNRVEIDFNQTASERLAMRKRQGIYVSTRGVTCIAADRLTLLTDKNDNTTH